MNPYTHDLTRNHSVFHKLEKLGYLFFESYAFLFLAFVANIQTIVLIEHSSPIDTKYIDNVLLFV